MSSAGTAYSTWTDKEGIAPIAAGTAPGEEGVNPVVLWMRSRVDARSGGVRLAAAVRCPVCISSWY